MAAANKTGADRFEMGDEYQKAEYALQAHRYDLVIELMRKVLSQYPENSEAFIFIARAYVRKKKPAEAMRALQEALRLNPDRGYAHMLYGVLLRDTGKNREAEEEFLTALHLNPLDHATHYMYASFLLTKKKDVKGARLHAGKALELDPYNAHYHLMLGSVLAKEGKIAEADEVYRQALSLDPDDPATLNSYGAYLFTYKANHQEALEFFRQALIRSPDNAEFKRNFLSALYGKHKFYSLFWQCSLFFRRLGWMSVLVLLAGFGLLYLAEYLQVMYPAVEPFVNVLVALLYIFVIYIWFANRLFRFLVQRGMGR